MNAVCTANDLSTALRIVKPAVNTESTLPILGNVLLTTAENTLIVTASNLEMRIQTQIPARVQDMGAITVPALALTDWVRLCAGDISLTAQEAKATLSLGSGKTKATVKGIEAAEFPFVRKFWTEEAGLPTLVFDPLDLEQALDRTVFSVSTDDARPSLTGVYLHAEPDGLTFVSTNGIRLSAHRIPGTYPKFPSLIIPATALREVTKIVAVETDQVQIVVNETATQVAFLGTDTFLVSQLIFGNYVDYAAIIPGSCASTLSASSAAIERALKTALVFSSTYDANPTSWNVSEKGLVITGAGAETGDQTSCITVDVTGAEVLPFMLDGKYALAMLKAMHPNQVEIGINSPTMPIVCRPAGDANYVHLIMTQTET